MNQHYLNYAYAIFLSREAFTEVAVAPHTYEDLRIEIAERYFNGALDFSFDDVLQQATRPTWYGGRVDIVRTPDGTFYE